MIARSITYEVGKDVVSGLAGMGATYVGTEAGTAVFGAEAGKYIGIASGILAGFGTNAAIGRLDKALNLSGLQNLTPPTGTPIPETQAPRDGLPEGANTAGNSNPQSRLPRNNGSWEGDPGNGSWYSDKPEVKAITNGDPVTFESGRPDFSPWSQGDIAFSPGKLNGTSDDFNAVYDHIKDQYGLPSRNAAKELLKDFGVTPHHSSSTVIQLIPTDLHKNIPHIGSASDLRGGF